jgi:hypothetical protein
MYSPNFFTIVVAFYQLFGSTCAQTVQTLLWNVPDGKATDLSLTFTNGVTLPLSWNNWTSTSYIDTSQTHVDLWVTSYDWNLNQYAEVLKSKDSLTRDRGPFFPLSSNLCIAEIDLTVVGNYAWTIAIPDKYLSTSAKYVLRFKIPATSYTPDTAQLSSPGFLVLRAATPSSSSTTSTSSSASRSSALPSQSTSTTSTAQSSSSATAPAGSLIASQSDKGLSTGAKAGLGVGISLGVLAIGALLGFVLARRKRQQKLGESPVYTEEKRNDDGAVTAPYALEPAELHGGGRSSYPAELHGS